jgi:hypothetical protein
VSEWLDSAGVDRLKLLNQPKNFGQITLGLRVLFGRQGQAG